MAKNTATRNGYTYKKISRTVGHTLNENGIEIPVEKIFYGKTIKECEQKYQDYLRKMNLGITTEKQYFGIVAESWIYDFFLKDDTLKPQTKELYVNRWNGYVKPSGIYHLELTRVTASVMQKFYNNLECPESAKKCINKMMKRFYKYLALEYGIRNFTGSLTIPKDKNFEDDSEITVWTDAELKTITTSFGKAQEGFRLRFLIVLAINTGARISELLGLKYSDFTDEGLKIQRQIQNVATIKKDEKSEHKLKVQPLKTASSKRTIPLNENVIRELELHRQWQRKDMLMFGYRSEYVFTTYTGGFYDRRNVTTALDRYYKRIGIKPKNFHVYRHTFGSNHCASGIPIQTTSALLGHSNISTTAKYYINVSIDEKQKAVDTLLSNIG